MKIEIREGYDIVITAETEADRKRLGKISDKYAACGVTSDLVAIPGLNYQITLRPKDPEEQALEGDS